MEANITFRDIDALIFLHPSVRRWLMDKPDSTVYNNYARNRRKGKRGGSTEYVSEQAKLALD